MGGIVRSSDTATKASAMVIVGSIFLERSSHYMLHLFALQLWFRLPMPPLTVSPTAK